MHRCRTSLISGCSMKKKETVIYVPCEMLDKEVMTFTNCVISKGNYLQINFLFWLQYCIQIKKEYRIIIFSNPLISYVTKEPTSWYRILLEKLVLIHLTSKYLFFCNRKFHTVVHKRCSLNAVLIQLNPVHLSQLIPPKIGF